MSRRRLSLYLCLLLALKCACATPSSGNTSTDSASSNNTSSNNTSSGSGSNTNSGSSDNSGTQTSGSQSQQFLTVVGISLAVSSVGLLVWNFYPSSATSRDSAVSLGQSTKGNTKRKAAKAAHAFFRSRETQLHQDLAVGAGPAIEDLAAAAEISSDHVSRFGALLHNNRAELLALLRPEQLTEERAAQALERIGELAKNDPTLARDYERFVARLERAPGF